MEFKYFEESLNVLKSKYGIDGIKDILLNRSDRIFLFTDIKEERIKLNVISDNLSIIGFEDTESIYLDDIVSFFDKDNKYALVGGREEYYQNIINQLYSFDSESYVSFPIINKKRRYWIRINIVPIDKNPNLRAVFITDVTQFLVNEEEIFIKTHKDSLTGVFNKYTLDYHYGERYQFDNFNILYLDLDDFKLVNDKLGHETGNVYLQNFAKILLDLENNYNRFYRIGGDEFVGFFFEEKEEVIKVAEEIISKTIELSSKDKDIETSVSIGILKTTVKDDPIKQADKLMYEAKNNGKNQYVYKVEESK